MKHFSLLVVMVSLSLAGCGGADLPELGKVSGVVTLAGQPLPDAIVTFTPAGEGRPSTGQTGSDGRYELQYNLDANGAIVGNHMVTVRLLMDTAADDAPSAADWAEMSDEQRRDAQAEGYTGPANELPPAASDGSITKEVKAGSNDIPIEL